MDFNTHGEYPTPEDFSWNLEPDKISIGIEQSPDPGDAKWIPVGFQISIRMEQAHRPGNPKWIPMLFQVDNSLAVAAPGPKGC